MNTKIDKKLKKIFLRVMGIKKIPNDFDKLKMGSYKYWDSINNLKLLMEIEEEFNIIFDMNELESLNNIKNIKKRIKVID